MTRLEKLYSIIENSREVGVKLNKEVLQQVEELEEGIIKEEILPSLANDIAPRLEPIKRDLVLVVEYHPGQSISVSLSRKTNISQIIEAKKLERDPEVGHSKGTSRKITSVKQPATGLCVYRKDGTFIQESRACDTFVKAIAEAGSMRVRNLGMTVCKVPLVSTTKDKKYGSAQHEVADGLYVITHTSTIDKKKQLDKISKALNLGWRVEIVK